MRILSVGYAALNNCCLLSRRRKMKKSVTTYTLVLLVCLGLTLSAQATPVDANEGWVMKLQPGESFTCIAQFIPDTPNVPDSLIFPQAPDWVELFVPEALSWDTALTDGGKTAYLYGPAITNNTAIKIPIFSYKLYYRWDDEDPDYDENYPLYLDVVVFNNQEIVTDFALRGIPGGPWDNPYEETWREQYGGPPYENPVPEPMTICLLGLGAAFLRKRH
jgi:hypothetical protein